MLKESTIDINTYPLEELYEILMTYELNCTETNAKTMKIKKEKRDQIALESVIDGNTSSENMNDEEIDDIFLLVKKWKIFRKNRRFQKEEENGKEKNRSIKKKSTSINMG